LSGQTITQRAIDIEYNTLTDAKIVIKDNRIYNSVWQGIYVNNVKGLVVDGNYVYNCGSYGVPNEGINITNCASVTVKNNFVDNSYFSNIQVYQSKDVSIENNVAKNSQTGYGILVYGSETIHSSNVLISGNSCFDDKATKTQSYGIGLQYIDNGACFGNLVLNNLNAGIFPIGNLTNFIIRGNIGYVTENSGTATFSGNGTQTIFTIPHGLATTPKTVIVTPGSADAIGNFYVTVDATNITVTYTTAPPSGTNNIILYWRAEV
jgi:nitrous oxidase accessory protein NosD